MLINEGKVCFFLNIFLNRNNFNLFKGIYAKRVISPGEDIFTDIPLIHAQTVDTLSISPACATCTTSLLTPAVYFETTWSRMSEKLQRQIEEYWPHITPIPCPYCPFEIYCSETCRDQAWNNYHRIYVHQLILKLQNFINFVLIDK